MPQWLRVLAKFNPLRFGGLTGDFDLLGRTFAALR
jgi:hypothetical protein